jgi:threonine synthase
MGRNLSLARTIPGWWGTAPVARGFDRWRAAAAQCSAYPEWRRMRHGTCARGQMPPKADVALARADVDDRQTRAQGPCGTLVPEETSRMAMTCARCGRIYDSREPVWRCACGGPLALETGAPLDPARVSGRAPTLWRYREALAVAGDPVSLGEPMTPLIAIEHQGRRVELKCDFLLPSGSYKDRGAAVLMTQLRAIGICRAVEDSSGNAAASLAAYAARAGIGLTVFCPASASPGKLGQIRLHGAELRLIDGPRPRATEALMAHVAATGTFYASHLWHPFFQEGIKTLAFEIAEQRGWRAPHAVLCPVGAGSILLGLWVGFRELHRAELIDRMPRLFAVQAERICPVYVAHERGASAVEAAASEPTLAEGIALPRPVRDREVLQAIRETDGGVARVSEDDIRQALVALGRHGVGVEPTSAVVLPALEQLWRAGRIRDEEDVVLVMSGSALKAGALLAEIVERHPSR